MNTAGQAASPGGGFDPGTYRPRPVAGVYVCDRGPASEPARFVLIAEDLDVSVPLTVGERQIWELFDGKRTVSDVCGDYLLRHRTLAPNRVYSLVNRLWQAGLLRDDPNFAPGPQRRQWLDRLQLTHRWPVPVPGSPELQRLLAPVARALRLHRRSVIVASALLIAVGIVLAMTSSVLPQFPLLRIHTFYVGDPELTARGLPQYSAGLILLLLLHLLFSFLRELWKGAVETRYTDRAEPVELVFNYGLPTFERMARWRPGLPPGPRLACGLAGVQFETILATVIMLVLRLGNWPAPVTEVLSKAVWVLYARSFLHLGPFLHSDFTALMRDMSGLRNYRRRALGFFRYGLIEALLGDEEMGPAQRSFVTWDLVAIAWLILAARFALDLLIRNQQIFYDLSLLLERFSGLASLIVVLLILPIAAAALLALGGCLYLVWEWAARKQIGDNAMAITGLSVSLAVVAVIVIRGAAWVAPAVVPLIANVLYVLSLVMFGGTMIVLMRNLRYRTGSAIGLKCLLLTVGLLGAIVLLILRRLPGSDAWLHRASAAAAAVCFLAYHALTPWRRQHLANYVRTPLFLPELQITVGTIVLLGLGALLAWRPMLPVPAGTLALVTFPAFVFLAAGVLTFFIQLNRVEVQLPPLLVERPQDAAEVLTGSFNFIIRGLEQIVDGKFGQRAIARLEQDIDAATEEPFSFGDLYVPESSDPAELGQRVAAILTRIRQALIDGCGERFADLAFETTFAVIHWQGRHALHRYAFPGTAWEERFRREMLLGPRERRDAVDSTTMFADLPDDDKELIIRHLDAGFAAPGEEILRQGEFGDTFYLLLDGRVQVEETDISGQRQLISILEPGDFFGETALLMRSRRTATVRAITEIRVLLLERTVFEALRRNHRAAVDHIVEHLSTLHALFKSQLFGELPTNLLRSILSRIQSRSLAANEVIIRKGDIGREFYLIKEGKVEVLAEEGDTQEQICELGPNDYFGEIALLRDIPRTATVRSLTPTEVLILRKDDFLQLTSSSAFLAANLEAVGTSRLQRGSRTRTGIPM